jgi:putative phage-type endonuclease
MIPTCEHLKYPTVVADSSGQTREEWLAQRHAGIGGSDAAAILGCSPWTSRFSLWRDKTSPEPVSTPETPAMAFGSKMEPVIRQAFADATGLTVYEAPLTYAHPEHPWMQANLDGLVATGFEGVDAILEVKTARIADAWADGPPPYYVSQVQHYLAVTGLKRAYVACLFGGVELRTYELERDQPYIDRLVNAEAAFWREVQEGTEPAVDGSESTYQTLRQTPVDPGTVVDLDSTMAELVTRRAELKAQIGELETELKAAEGAIMRAMGEAETGRIDGETVITWKAQSRTAVDTKALKAAHPDIVAEFVKASTFRVLRIRDKAADA